MSKIIQQIKTKPPILEMEYYSFPKVHLDMNTQTPDEEELNSFFDLDYKIDVDVHQADEDPSRYRLKMSIRTEDETGAPKAYRLNLDAVGFFKFSEQCDQEKQGNLIYVLGQTLLYGASREFLRSVSANGPLPQLYLPPVTFVPEDIQEESLTCLPETEDAQPPDSM